MLQVYLHYAVKSADDEVLFSTFSADDGIGIPQPFVLGKGMRMPRGWELGLQSKIKYTLLRVLTAKQQIKLARWLIVSDAHCRCQTRRAVYAGPAAFVRFCASGLQASAPIGQPHQDCVALRHPAADLVSQGPPSF